MKAKATAVLLVSLLALAPCAFAAAFAEVGDAGSTPATAQITPSGPLTSITGGMGTEADVDFFKIYLTGDFFRATTAAVGFDSVLSLWDNSGMTRLLNNDDYPGLGTNSRIETSLLSAGNYFLGISQFGARTGTYTISLEGAEGAREPNTTPVPDSASTLPLLGLALAGIAWVRRFGK
jgi:hypothetical protein